MDFQLFSALFPEDEEVRYLNVLDHLIVPDESYYFLEFYCADPACDCQIVHFNVVTKNSSTVHASIVYGWNTKAFYDDYFYQFHNFPGPELAMLQPQGPYADFFLKWCKERLISDRSYVDRLKRHYALFKERRKVIKRLGRNAPCPCGRGKKVKKCCD